VYSAEQKLGTTTRKVALKTLHAHLSHDPSIAARFNREVGTIAQLEHPNTIKVYDFGATPEGTLYIAMEFVAGKSLSQLLQESGALPPDRVLKIMRQIAGSLEEAHGQGVIHRDLKPDNVVLTQRAGEKDVVKLLDFGIAARTEGADAAREQKLTQQGMVLGTPPYMSPEQFTGKPLDARSDIYSLAVILYEVLTGKLPFEARTPMEYIQFHVTKAPIPIDQRVAGKTFPQGLSDVLLKALEKKPEQRFESASDFADALKPFAGMAGKGFTAMMPKGQSEELQQAIQAAKAAEAAAPPTEKRPPPMSAKTVKYGGNELAATTPQGHAVVGLSRRKPPQAMSPLVLVAIAASCLVAGILLTVLVMSVLGGKH
jgi:serine/threonine-protein kinase